MRDPQKIRGDAKLKNLPRARQDEIAAMARGTTLALAVEELRKDGLELVPQTLSAFLSWHARQLQWEQLERFSADMVELKQTEEPGLSEEDLRTYGHRVFQVGAIDLASSDPETAAMIWTQMEKVRLKASELDLARQKFQRETAELFLRWSEDQRAKEITTAGGLGQSEKIEKLGQLMFGEDWDSATGHEPTKI